MGKMRATRLANIHALNMIQARLGVVHGNEAEMGSSEGRKRAWRRIAI
jgi:hypothetical protein